ncbi:MAG: hemolysin family protein [Polyangiaceae bacterium]|nr:hemolysin family protein [Polyangiaceae bacterium]
MIVALVLLSGVLSGAEVAIAALRSAHIQHLGQRGGGKIRALRRLRESSERVFATTRVSVTLLGTLAGTLAGATAVSDLAAFLRSYPAVERFAEPLAVVVAAVPLTAFSLVAGELIPKSLSLRYPAGYALFAARPFLALSFLLQPFVWILVSIANLFLRLFGDRTTFSETRCSPEELQHLVGDAAQAGSIDPGVGAIASRAIDFGDLCAGHVMVPRGKVIGLPRSASPEEMQRVILEEGHSRMPIYDGTIDKVIGYVMVRDLVAVFWEKDLIVLEDVIRPAYVVPRTTRAVELLNEMKRRRTQLAVVVDETGTMVGIVTLEDLLEQIVGDIWSEDEEVPPAPIRREADGSAIVLGEVRVRDANRELGLLLPESEDWATIAGLCLSLAGRIPAPGDVLDAPDGTQIEIVDATPRRVGSVRLRPRSSEPSVVKQ